VSSERQARGPRMPTGSDRLEQGLTRRRLLEVGAGGALAIGTGSLLAACGASSPPGAKTTPTSAAGGAPVRGGTLKLGMTTGGTAETVNPGNAATFTDNMRINQLFNFLFVINNHLQTVPSLATSAEPNRDASIWTLHLRDGVKWHDGKPFTADDVVWTIRGWGSPANFAHGVLSCIDFTNVRKRGRSVVEVPLTRPVAQFPTLFSWPNAAIVQNGATFKEVSSKPVGTGPFKFVSFTPGTQSVFARNPDYWGDPEKPYIDTLVMDTSFTDEASRNNALLSGALDVSSVYPPALAKQQLSGGQVNVLRAPGSDCAYFTMRVNEGPLADVRVRKALKLLADRPALVEGTFNGLGEVGNDNYVIDVEYTLQGVHPVHDVEQAKSLLKAAGRGARR